MGEVILTASTHKSGTDRIAEAADKLNLQNDGIVVNIQGDEPFIHPKDINLLTACFENQTTQIATLVKKINAIETLENPNNPKVVLNANKEALYFSRAPIPHLKDLKKEDWLNHHTFYKHIGIYGFRTAALKEISQLPSSLLEQKEGLEQLRWLENGYRIQTAETNSESIAVDCPEDLIRIDKNSFHNQSTFYTLAEYENGNLHQRFIVSTRLCDYSWIGGILLPITAVHKFIL